MSGDDELRRRLREIPAPGARLDADAVIAGAKRKRKPKTVALSSAATIAGVLIVAPLVVPGMSPLLPPSTSDVASDAGAAPESAPEPLPGSPELQSAPAEEDGPAGTGQEGTDEGGAGDGGATDSGDGDTGASGGEGGPVIVPLAPGEPWCGLTRAGDAGLALAMAEAPAAGEDRVRVKLQAIGGGTVELTVSSVLLVDGGAGDDPAGDRLVARDAQTMTLAPGVIAVLDQPTAILDAGACGDGTPSAPVPVAIVAIDGGEPIGIVGSALE